VCFVVEQTRLASFPNRNNRLFSLFQCSVRIWDTNNLLSGGY